MLNQLGDHESGTKTVVEEKCSRFLVVEALGSSLFFFSPSLRKPEPAAQGLKRTWATLTARSMATGAICETCVTPAGSCHSRRRDHAVKLESFK